MVVEIALILVAYYMGRKEMTLQDVYFLAVKLLEKDEDK